MKPKNNEMEESKPGEYLEYSHLSGINNIARDIAQRLKLRHRLGGPEYIICEQPAGLLILIERRWQRMMRQLLAKRAAVDDGSTEKLVELSRQITYMQNLKFTESPWDEPEARVNVITPAAAIKFPPLCSAIYIATPSDGLDRQLVTSNMPNPRLVVVYGSA